MQAHSQHVCAAMRSSAPHPHARMLARIPQDMPAELDSIADTPEWAALQAHVQEINET